MSFKDAIDRASDKFLTKKEIEQKMEESRALQEHLDLVYKARVKPFALETTSQGVLEAYYQMINGRNTDRFSNETNYLTK